MIMIATSHAYGSVIASVYVMNTGEKIARHQHTFPHTTSVAAGESEVEIYDSSIPFKMSLNMQPVELPALIDHEIRALVDGTVVINIQAAGPSHTVSYSKQEPASSGGVMLHDGTIVNEKN